MNAFIVTDLVFGDAGKGTLIDYLARRHTAHTVVRFNGGAQAAHNVVTPDGRHHTFSQFGSATLVPGVRTHLSRFVLVDPPALAAEEAHLRTLGVTDAFARLSVDRRAPVVTPFHRATNRLREIARGSGRHGSCGMGIGETMADLLDRPDLALFVGDLADPTLTRRKLRALQEYKAAQAARLVLPDDPAAQREQALLQDVAAPAEFAALFADILRHVAIVDSSAALLRKPGTVLFEGAQGVLLDEWLGFHPHTTWSTTTFANAFTLLQEARYPGDITRLGVVRAYLTRHGPGPFVTEDPALARHLPEPHNRTNPWQRDFRVGWPDLVMLRYALDAVGGPGALDAVAVTCMDHLARLPAWQVCTAYTDAAGRPLPQPVPTWDRDLAAQEKITAALLAARPSYAPLNPAALVPLIESALHAPVRLTSWGPTHADKREHPGRAGLTPPPETAKVPHSRRQALHGAPSASPV
jgi:adenylosuccinate synthase